MSRDYSFVPSFRRGLFLPFWGDRGYVLWVAPDRDDSVGVGGGISQDIVWLIAWGGPLSDFASLIPFYFCSW